MLNLNHELQVIVTVTLLAVTAVLALISDYLRIRSLRRASGSPAKAAQTSSMAVHVLVPELPGHAEVSGGRASRLAAALKQPRRELSAGARAAIERGSQLATPPRKSAAVEAARSLQRVG